MNCRRETVKMNVPPGNPAVPRDWIRGVLEKYVAGSDIRGRPEGRSYPRSKQAINETSGLDFLSNWRIIIAADRIFTP
jgi:hypothetical protein